MSHLLSGDESDQPAHRRGSFGKPAPGLETKVVDPDGGRPCPRRDGRAVSARRPVMLRYYKRSREDSFDADGWFHTGDLVRTDNDGFYYFTGRLGSMIKTAGANVSPAEVQHAITGLTGAPAT